MSGEDDLMLVNTLDAEHFDETRTPGSINIPQSNRLVALSAAFTGIELVKLNRRRLRFAAGRRIFSPGFSIF